MDASRFDALLQAIGTRSGRRALLRGGVGTAVALAVSSALRAGTEAKKKPKPKCDKQTKRKCAKQDLTCEKGKCVVDCPASLSQCLNNGLIRICGNGEDACVCSRLREGGSACTAQLDDPGQTCPATSECKKSSDCGKGEVCIDASGSECCNRSKFGLCVKKCKVGAPGPL